MKYSTGAFRGLAFIIVPCLLLWAIIAAVVVEVSLDDIVEDQMQIVFRDPLYQHNILFDKLFISTAPFAPESALLRLFVQRPYGRFYQEEDR